MNSRHVIPFADIQDDNLELVGGKGLSLAQMTRAGFPVPPGFCVTTVAYRAAVREVHLPVELRDEILQQYLALGEGPVAVRSSATLEDGATASFAGQQETFLEITGGEEVLAAIRKCWDSLHTERAVAYRTKQGIDDDLQAMAVVVQRMVPADVAGVLFTRDPLDATGKNMLIEAARGLGEAVVSGRVMPDLFRLDRETLAIVDQQRRGDFPSDTPVFSDAQLVDMAQLGLRVEEHFGSPRDVEWAFGDEQLWLLQARPITTAIAFEREQVRHEIMHTARELAAGQPTIWARYNLAEVLPAPTPLTWSIIKRMVAANGGMGEMYRELGFDPDPALNESGAFDLIGGRPYVNLNREGKMYFRDFPYGHDFAALKANPALAIYPTPTVVPTLATWRTWLRLPLIAWKMAISPGKLLARRKSAADHLQQEVFPQARKRAEEDAAADLKSLGNEELLQRLQDRIEEILVRLASQTLQPAMFAATAMAELEAGLSALNTDVNVVKGWVRSLLLGAHPSAGDDLPHTVEALAAGKMSRDVFLRQFGHRGSKEMELAEPRWKESPQSLPVFNENLGGDGLRELGGLTPTARRSDADAAGELEQLISTHKSSVSTAMAAILADARRYLALREAGKNIFILRYASLRQILLAIGERTRLGSDLFYLTLEELPQTLAGADLRSVIAERKTRRQLELSLSLPSVLFSDDLEAIGRAAEIPSGALVGTPLSLGEFTGPALVLEEPISADDLQPGYVLVCPTTDPAWVPLFLKAGALVMETGGVLSHGAIVAREFGLPAVAGLADIQRQLKTGQTVRVDGNSGIVEIVASATSRNE